MPPDRGALIDHAERSSQQRYSSVVIHNYFRSAGYFPNSGSSHSARDVDWPSRVTFTDHGPSS
jgi:hypothetical protein